MRHLYRTGRLITQSVIISLLFASCANSRLHYLGYTYWGSNDPKVDYENWGKDFFADTEIDLKNGVVPSHYFSETYNHRLSKSNNYGLDENVRHPGYVPLGMKYHGHYFLKDGMYEYAVFCPEGYISEMDVLQLKKTLRDISGRTLERMLAPMAEGSFVYDIYSKKYCRILSDAIKEAVMSVKVKSEFSDLGGWQMFKPVEGIDKQGSRSLCKISYKGDGWYDITAPSNRDAASISVRMGFGGKYFNSIIIGVKNEKMGVNISDMRYNTRYNNTMLTFTQQDDIVYTYMFMKFLCPKVYKMVGSKDVIFEEDFAKVVEQVVAKEKAFVHEYYDALRASGNDMRKIIKKYRYQMAQHFAGSIDEQVKKNSCGVDIFLPCNFGDFVANGYTVDYMGEDCFKVTSGGKSLYLKVVLYGKNLTPAIMGVKNPAQGVDYCPDRFPWADSIK